MMRVIGIDQVDDSLLEHRELPELPEVERILSEVKERGDAALEAFTFKFDGVRIKSFRFERSEIEDAYAAVDKRLVSAIKESAERLERFSKAQMEMYGSFEIEIERGVLAGQTLLPIGRVGVYVPGGRFPLVSSLIMGAVPAKTAGVKEVVVCSPPTYEGSVHPAILVAADIANVDEVYRIGGAQALGAMAYGTQSVKCVDKIVGPGNVYVNAAKKLLFGRVGIDFIAGPTEMLIIADGLSEPSFIAADLIAQAEHDTDSIPVLVTDSPELAERVNTELARQLEGLKTAAVARESLGTNGLIVIVDAIDRALDLANKMAPEHLELYVQDAGRYLPMLRNYGSLFVGGYSAGILGDYSSGLNHVLPTNRASRYTGGLTVRDFLKIQTTLKVSEMGFLAIAPAARTLAEAEGLEGHANSVNARMRGLDGREVN